MIVAFGKAYLAIAFLIPFTSSRITETSDLKDTDYKLAYPKDNNSLYGYDGGPGSRGWDGICSKGRMQSPIDLEESHATIFAPDVDLRIDGADQVPISAYISNSGTSVEIRLKTPKPITATGGALGNDTYEFQQLHFHWGADDHEGSEHTLNSKRLPLESNFVFQKRGCKNPTLEKDCLAVMSVLYNLSPKKNRVLQPIVLVVMFGLIDNFHDSIVKLGGFKLEDYLPKDLQTYFMYKGSLTTPPCTEGVTRMIFGKRKHVSGKQVSTFRKIKDQLGRNVEYNYRETQPLNGRETVYAVSPQEYTLLYYTGKIDPDGPKKTSVRS